MNLRKRFSSSLRPLLAHRLRALLALLGVAVGVGAMIVSRAVGAGAREEMRRSVERLGANLLIIKPLPVPRLAARPQVSGLACSLRPEDGDAMVGLASVRLAAPAVERPARAKAGAVGLRTTVRGSTAAFARVRGFTLAAGRMVDAGDERASRRVAVVGARVEVELGQGRSLLGRELRLAGVPYEVVGVFQPRGSTAEGADQDNFVLVPLQTALRRVFNATWLTNIYASVTEPARMNEAEAAIQRLLRERHRRGRADHPVDFSIQNPAKTRAIQQEMIASLSRYGTGLAGVALLIGGSGILALMLLSVRERTAEIGLRMAIGAEPRDILLQFLIEAAALALAGWAAGAALAGCAALAVARATAWPLAFPSGALGGSLALALAIGFGFGALPARAAARVPPIEALLNR